MKPRARGTYAASVLRSSDVVRRRAREVALVVTVVAAAAFALLTSWAPGKGAPSRTSFFAVEAPGALSHAHRSAELTCASCHASGDAATACATCHDQTTHLSRRPPHRALEDAKTRTLTCTSCHPAHDHTGDRVEVHLDKTTATTWRGESSIQVPLTTPAVSTWMPIVPTKPCAACHDLANTRDPIFRCVAAGAVVVSCFDEHTDSRASAAVITDVRHVTSGSTFAALVKSSSTAPPRLLSSAPLVRFGALAVVSLGVAAYVGLGAVMAKRAGRGIAAGGPGLAATPAPNVAVDVDLGRRRLPVIDAARCLGCRACVDACAFDVLEIARFVAVVARPDACCSAVVCADVCPNGSLTLVDGGKVEDRARIGSDFESPDAPGIFLAGDLTGVPLIKNAIRQGRDVADRVGARARGSKSEARDMHDLLIVGAGPAGLSATLRAQELGLSVVTLEQGELAASIRAFPRGKLVFERPLSLPLEGDLWMEECTKEDLILQWERVVRAHRLPIKTRHRVLAVTKREHDDGFDVRASSAENEVSFRARHVLFAVGTRGTPRPLSAPIDPGAASRVAYTLVDAASFANKRVVVVGLGDAAMEAALALSRQGGCDVTVVHRSKDFTRGSARNVADMRAAVAEGRVHLHFEAAVTRVAPAAVELSIAGKTAEIPFDQMFVLVGGSPPWPLLAESGVALRTDADDFGDRGTELPV